MGIHAGGRGWPVLGAWGGGHRKPLQASNGQGLGRGRGWARCGAGRGTAFVAAGKRVAGGGTACSGLGEVLPAGEALGGSPAPQRARTSCHCPASSLPYFF